MPKIYCNGMVKIGITLLHEIKACISRDEDTTFLTRICYNVANLNI